ncbi:MAG: TetR/AcrR family transcriptional regulator [Chitinophagales bacterium]
MNGNGTETRERILKAALELFFSYGIRSITMDDIARHLSISKKTIYHFFEDKDQIVHTLTMLDMKENEKMMKEISAKSRDAVDEILQAMECMTDQLTKFHPSLIYDLQKFHPKSWREFRRFTQDHSLSSVMLNLKRGIRQGLYRSDINIPILARLRIEEISLGMDPQIYPPHDFELKKVEVELLKHFLYGILTIKGQKLLEQYESNHKSRKQKIVA